MRKGILFAGFLLLVIGRHFLQAKLNFGMGLIGSEPFLLVLSGELVFLALILLGGVYILRKSKWPLWLAIAPAIPALLSSPILFQFGKSWANHGWQVADVVELMSIARIVLVAFLVTIAFAPDAEYRDHTTIRGG